MERQTRIHDARAQVQHSRTTVDEKLDAIDRFVDRVEDCVPGTTPSSPLGVTATVGTTSRRSRTGDDACKAVRQAFAETIRPHSLDDVKEQESLQKTIRAELSGPIAVALAPTTKIDFSSELKRAILSATDARRAETEALRCFLEQEATQVDDATTVVDEITKWMVTADETPLTELGFEELQERHERLATYRTRCGAVAKRRQSFLNDTTNSGVDVGLNHRSLVPDIYRDLPVDHPVLVTVAGLEDTCQDCQRAVRDHLVRRA